MISSSTRLGLCSRRCLVGSYSESKLLSLTYIRTRQSQLCYSTSSNASSSSTPPPAEGPSSPSESVAENIVKSKPAPALTWLPRPLGVREPPSSQPKTWAQTKAELLDREKHLEKRRHLYVYP